MKRRRPKSQAGQKSASRPYKIRRRETEFRPRVHDSLHNVLRQVGEPDEEPFVEDPFQTEAIALIDKMDVVVSAPTGSGKTYIAVEAAKKILKKGGKVWYASPLKALSNAKYLEFGKIFGTDNVGLLTGDHKVNAEAPLVVGTTEILRNQLYDAMSRGENLATDLVVMDEAHYLGDPDRGVVWEEVIIYLPSRIRLLLLSATIANADEISNWLAHIRGEKARPVHAYDRPVPLYPLFLFPDGLLTPLSRGRLLAPPVRHFVQSNPPGERGGGPRIQQRHGRVMNVLDQADLLPAIFFLKSRSDCDQALKFAAKSIVQDPEKEARRSERLDELLEKYPFLRTHGHIRYLRGPGIAAHHAGHLPHYKMVVEQLMQEGLLNAIFSTSTVAAGVNFPARTVVIPQSDRFNGRDFSNLTSTELLQMTGRAGRRGMDRIGFALILPGQFQNVELVHNLFRAEPDPVLSRLNINFSMVLNLLMSQTPKEIKKLLELSLAAYQQGRSKASKEMTRIMDRLMVLVAPGACDGAEEALHLFSHRHDLEREAFRLKKNRPWMAWESALEKLLTPGRIFEVSSGKQFCVLDKMERHGQPGVLAAKLKDDLGLKKGRVRGKYVPIDKVMNLFETRLEIDQDTDPLAMIKKIQKASKRRHRILDHEKVMAEVGDDRLSSLDARAKAIEDELESQPCGRCSIFKHCLGSSSGEIHARLSQLRRLESESQILGRMLWASFLRHLTLLKSENFVDENDQLTEDGHWAAKLRLDHPLLIASGIRSGAWPEDDPALLAATVAPFVIDKEIDPSNAKSILPEGLKKAWFALEEALGPLSQRLQAAGFATPALNPRPALAIYSWAIEDDWDTAVQLYGQDQGDMAMLVFRAADNLRQMAALKDTHPELAQTARNAVNLILKEPVTIPL